MRKGKAPDGGWGWVVAAACYFDIALLSIPSLCYSILFSRFLVDLGASTTTINWIMGAHSFVGGLAGLFVGPLVMEFGPRRVSGLGSLLACLCFLALVFVQSTWYLLVIFSPMGIFSSMALKPCYLLISFYFERRRGLAYAFLMAGMSSGLFAGPPLVRYLLDEYSLRGAILVLGAIILHSVPATCLFQPVEWHLKPLDEEEGDDVKSDGVLQGDNPEVHGGRQGDDPKVEVLQNDGALQGDGPEVNSILQGDDPKVNSGPESDNDCDLKISRDEVEEQREGLMVKTQELEGKSVLTRHVEGQKVSEFRVSNLSLALAYSEVCSMASLPSLIGNQNEDVEMEAGAEEVKETSHCSLSGVRRCPSSMLRIIRSAFLNLAILRSFQAIVIISGAVCSSVGYQIFLVMIPFAIQNIGYTLSDAAWCLSITAIANMVARLVTSPLSDFSFFNMRIVYMTGASLMTVSLFALGFLRELVWLKVAMALYGYGVGTTSSLTVLAMPKYLGVDKLPAIYGATYLVMAFLYVIVGPLVGFIRDLSGSYTAAMCATGVLVAVCVVMWGVMPAAVEYDRKRELKEQEKAGVELTAGLKQKNG